MEILKNGWMSIARSLLKKQNDKNGKALLGGVFYMCRMREYAFRGGIYNTYKLQRNKKLNFICMIIDIYE